MLATSRMRAGFAWPAAGALALWVVGACWVAACAVQRGASATPLPRGARAEEPLDARFWRAGRLIPPGLSAARVAELEAERSAAAAGLANGLTRSEEARLVAWLADAETSDELWCAAAQACAALERYDLAPFLCAALEPSSSARRTVAARAALHVLYGRWFQRPSELAPYLDSVQAGTGTRLLLHSNRREEARSRERLLAELAHRPTSAAAWLADPDPEVRSGAARTLAQVFTQAGEDRSGTLEVLIAHLESEHEPHAFHEGLQACIAPLERAGVDQPASARLRAHLVEIARSAADPRTLSAAQALARIPWRANGPRDLGHVLSGVEALGAMLRGLAAADRSRGVNDPDTLVGVLAALRELCEQADSAGLSAELRAGSTRTTLFGVIADSLQDEAARAAAAAALGPLARVSDGAELAALLEDPTVGAQVKHALLGALGAILPELEPGAPGADALLAAVAAQTGASDSDLRRRALALCAEPRLERLVRRLDPTFLAERLEHEEGREAVLELLRLIQRFGRADMLDALLALERFERLCSDPATLEVLAGVLRRLAGTSGSAVMEAAERLAAVRAEQTGLARLRHALALVDALSETTAFELEPRQHRAIAAWVWRCLRAGVAPRDLAPSGLAFEQRLLSVHLPRGESRGGESGDGLGVFENAHLTALLRADSFLGAADGARRGTKPQVETAFESAHAHASTSELRLLVLRDRARFRAAANECVKAMSDYRRLFAAGVLADPLLGIPDLRSAVELLERLGEAGSQGRSATAGEACGLLSRIIARGAWRAEPAAVRMQDLRDWVRTALDSADAPSLRRVDAALADLPLTQLETQLEREPAPIWFGLTRESGWFQELLDLRARTRMGLRELEAQG
jgi:hypothetical protein